MKTLPLTALLGLAVAGLCATPQAHATLLSYWNFNNDSVAYNGGSLGSFSTGAASYGETYSSTNYTLSSNTANGTVFNGSNIYIDLSNLTTPTGGQPVLNGLVYNTSTQATTSSGFGGYGVFSDTSTNLASGDTSTGGSLLVLNPNSWENGHYITFALSSAGYNSLALSYASRVTNTTSISEVWSYSLNGTTFTTLSTQNITGTGAFAAYNVNLSSLSSSAVDNQGTFYLRLTLNGGANSIALDNIQLTGSAIPEPATYGLLASAGLFAFAFWRKRRARA